MTGPILLDDFGRPLGLFRDGRTDDENEITDRPEDCGCPACRDQAAEIDALGREHLAPRSPDDGDLGRTEAFP